MSLLVILGAGASHDCVSPNALFESVNTAYSWIPPLTNQLFVPRKTFGGIMSNTPALGLIAHLRSRLERDRANLEEELDRVEERADGGDAVASVELMALRFYLREVLERCSREWPTAAFGTTNYHWLVRRLDEWARDTGQEVVYVTFNYDTILELALTGELCQGVNSLDDYLAHPRARLYKPHGSVNWGHRVSREPPFNDDERSWVINNAAALPDLGPIEIRTAWASGQTGEAWVPALAVPIQRKRAFVCPDGHLERLAEDLSTVDRMLIIGWRATEEHFLELLSRQLTGEIRRVVVACHDADEARSAWYQLSQALRGARIGRVDNDNNLGFSDLVGHETIEGLLRV